MLLIDQDWVNLYEYVKRNIMGYDDNQKLPKHMVLRLKGLAEGKFMANKNVKNEASYSYKVILLTFKKCRLDIMNAFKTNSAKWKDESHKFNYIMVIIEKEINNIYKLLKNNEKAKEKTEEIVLENQVNERSEYNKKSKENKNKQIEALW